MNIANVERGERAFFITWDDRSITECPFIWLRDNDPAELHPQTRERIFDLTSVDLDVKPESFELDRDRLAIRWPRRSEASVYTDEWLQTHRPGRMRDDPAIAGQTLWDGETLEEIPRADASACARSPAALKDMLLSAKQFGLVIVQGLDDSPAAGKEFGDLIGFKRETNFGVMFDVISRPDPNNLAYTSMALPLHTDLPNQYVIPSYQFLHNFRNTAAGGESIFADGFRICADIARERPRQFELLKRIPVPWRFHDACSDVRRHRPIISQRADGEFDCFVFNAHIADVPDMEVGLLYDFYAAYRDLMIRVRHPKYAVQFAMAPGEMVVFDNWRVLHGRTAFDAASGDRHLRGYYIERNEIDNCIRVLSRNSPREPGSTQLSQATEREVS